MRIHTHVQAPACSTCGRTIEIAHILSIWKSLKPITSYALAVPSQMRNFLWCGARPSRPATALATPGTNWHQDFPLDSPILWRPAWGSSYSQSLGDRSVENGQVPWETQDVWGKGRGSPSTLSLWPSSVSEVVSRSPSRM